MPKKVKCKKCHLEYDKKVYECPYCHKKRFNPTGLIIALVVAVILIGTGALLKGDEILSTVANINSVQTIDGIKFNVIEKQ